MSNRLMAGIAMALTIAGGGVQALGVSGQGTWETTLQPRDLDGDHKVDAFYDTVLDVTWLRDANMGGQMNWNQATTWAQNLVVGSYSDWRLPNLVDTGAKGCDWSITGGTDCGFNVQTKSGGVVYSELAHLWYETLGNKAQYAPVTGVPQANGLLSNTGGFENLQSFLYWTATEFAPYEATHAWYFSVLAGWQDGDFGKGMQIHAIAVRAGDVMAPVPEPESLLMMLAGLVSLGIWTRRRAAC